MKYAKSNPKKKKTIIKKTKKTHVQQTRKRKRMIGGDNYIKYNDDTESYFVLLRDAILPTDKRFHTLLGYDYKKDRIVCRDLPDVNRIVFKPILKKDPTIPTTIDQDSIIVRTHLKNLFGYMFTNLWRKKLTHGDATDTNIIYDPINDTLVLIDWEELRYTNPDTPAHDHKLLARIVVDMINLVTAVEIAYGFAFNINIWTDPTIQHILLEEKNADDDAPDGLSDHELHGAFRYLVNIAYMKIK